jgi:hypothetical protein
MKRFVFAAALMVAGFSAFGFAAEPAVGAKAPAFTLTDTEGKSHSLADFKGKYVVLEWINLGCPFVRKHYDSGNMQTSQQKAKEMGAVWLSICSSAEGKQGNMKAEEWQKAIGDEKMASSAVLLDAKGTVGKSYGAKTTPHMYVINPEGILIYKGAIDDKPTADKADVPGAKNYVLTALNEAQAGKPVSTSATTPYGCSVKYK